MGTCGNMNRKKKNAWWNREIKDTVKEKRVTFLVWLQNKSEENERVYKECKKRVKKLVKEAKKREWVEFGEDLECAGHQRNKVFWTKIKNVRNGDKKRVSGSVLDKSGNLVVGKKNVLNGWKECFDDLLNVECESSVNETIANTGTDMGGFNTDGIEAAIKKLGWGKAAGLDEIRNEYLKCSGAIGVQWFHRIFNVAWQSAVVPNDWTGAVIFPIHKKENTMTAIITVEFLY